MIIYYKDISSSDTGSTTYPTSGSEDTADYVEIDNDFLPLQAPSKSLIKTNTGTMQPQQNTHGIDTFICGYLVGKCLHRGGIKNQCRLRGIKK